MSRIAIALYAFSACCLLGAGFAFFTKGYQNCASFCFVAAALVPMWAGDRAMIPRK